MRSRDINTDEPVADPRIAHGYDPNAVGSYYPDPEDYPAADVDDGPTGVRMPMTSRLSQRWLAADTARRGELPDEFTAQTPPSALGPGSPATTGAVPARRLTDSAVFAVIVAVVLGLAAVLVFIYGRSEATAPGPPASVVTPTAPAPPGDARPDPTVPADQSPDAEPTGPSDVPAAPGNQQRLPGDDDRDGDGGDDD